LVTSTRLSLVATAEEDRPSFSAANNGQQEKSPSSEAGARLGFDGSNNNGRPLSPQQRDFWKSVQFFGQWQHFLDNQLGDLRFGIQRECLGEWSLRHSTETLLEAPAERSRGFPLPHGTSGTNEPIVSGARIETLGPAALGASSPCSGCPGIRAHQRTSGKIAILF
jgi:hypothetical protein